MIIFLIIVGLLLISQSKKKELPRVYIDGQETVGSMLGDRRPIETYSTPTTEDYTSFQPSDSKITVTGSDIAPDSGDTGKANRVEKTSPFLYPFDQNSPPSIYGVLENIPYYKWIDKWDDFIFYMVDNKYRTLDPAWIKAIAYIESGFNNLAIRNEPQINDASIGIMQLLVKTAQWIGHFDNYTYDELRSLLFEPYPNIAIGMKYLHYQYARYGGDYVKATAAYNSGTVFFDKGGNIINQAYVTKVLQQWNRFQNHFPNLST